ncbi:hypothetical protein EDD29_6240 [Actinocorallia herbida]|uniref:Uncharacterized protein n=1 Tax=Actinocorallia herbida TaxID=58109 RepID=A0A3N1D514_9ACTN|nr:CehA/McbA family metallohydrolase [Actinocorallia herbida]ROO88569.1 hypothetical protein EDD29_6240 [Actinocorallia herbida]
MPDDHLCDDHCLPGGLPAPVAAALALYRGIVAREGANWNESALSLYGPLVPYLRHVSHVELLASPVLAGLRAGLSLDDAIDTAPTRDMPAAFRDALDGRVPDGVAVLTLTDEGVRFLGPETPQPVLSGEPFALLVVVESAVSEAIEVAPLGTVQPGGCLAGTLDAREGPLLVGGREVALPETVRETAKARLRLRSPEPCRWSVLSPEGRGWFPEGMLRKWDAHGRAYFHGSDVLLDVPAEELTVIAARGMDFSSATARVSPSEGETLLVELDPAPARDPAAAGWYGGDLHLHLNFAGDQVAGPADAARMQAGEALHVLNPLAANATTDFVFDREALTAWAGRDLPWSAPEGPASPGSPPRRCVQGPGVGLLGSPPPGRIARMGAEYRNDLLGHVASFGAEGEPSHYYSGHPASGRPADRPSVTAMCAEIHARGGIVTWAHPLGSDTPDPLDALFQGVRSCAARELVVAAALGLVDGLDVLTHLSCTGTARMYRRLLGAGVRLAVTAGTDVMLSYGRLATYSNPPGWARVYARLDGPLSLPAYQDAIRAGRTFATNGPWLALDVAGHGPGERAAAESGHWLRVRATVTGPRNRVRIYDAEGVVAEGEGEVEVAYDVRHPTYLVAEAEGPAVPEILDPRGAYAHTSPVHVDVSGRTVARAEDLRWCLRWIERLGALLAERARDPDPALPALLERAASVYRDRLPGLGP